MTPIGLMIRTGSALALAALAGCASRPAPAPASPFYVAGPPAPSVENPPRDPNDPNGGAN